MAKSAVIGGAMPPPFFTVPEIVTMGAGPLASFLVHMGFEGFGPLENAPA